MNKIHSRFDWMTRDAWLIVYARGLRSLAQGSLSVIMAIYLYLLGFSTMQIGLFLSAGIGGAAAYSLAIVFFGDTLGRRRLLIWFTLLPAVTALVLTLTASFSILSLLAFIGCFSVAGGASASGPAQPLEQASLASRVGSRNRTDLYALYGIVRTSGIAIGALSAGLPVFYQHMFGIDELTSLRVVFVTSAALFLLAGFCYAMVSSAVEVEIKKGQWSNPLRLPSRRIIFTLSGLFSLDHFAGGLVVESLVSLWFFSKFGVELQSIGVIFLGSNILGAISLFIAAKLANRIGLINTMVFTHIPASLLLIAIPFLPSAWLAAIFWLARGFCSRMDVPTRESYTMAIVAPEERVAMAGLNTTTRSVTGTISPSLATLLWSMGAVSLPFIVCGVLKIGYDLSLYFMFRDVHPPEENVAEL